jgi:hypothetical protein
MAILRSNRNVPGIGERRSARGGRMGQFSFMRDPEDEKDKDRTRGWLKGMIVQIDNKMIAVQFRSNVFLTDGWMVPDRILWYPVHSEHIRPLPGKKSKKKETEIPDY